MAATSSAGTREAPVPAMRSDDRSASAELGPGQHQRPLGGHALGRR